MYNTSSISRSIILVGLSEISMLLRQQLRVPIASPPAVGDGRVARVADAIAADLVFGFAVAPLVLPLLMLLVFTARFPCGDATADASAASAVVDSSSAASVMSGHEDFLCGLPWSLLWLMACSGYSV